MKEVSGELAIHCRAVTKAFGHGRAKVRALRGVDLDVAANQLVFLVGPSGCGKTTLISILSGVLNPDEGVTEVFGTNWAALSDDARTRRRAEMVGFIFQDFNLIPTLSAVENCEVPLILRGCDRKQARQRAAHTLDEVGLGDRLHAMPAELSGGMQQRVAIARALVSKPRLLVCDEPTANLDGKTGHSVMEVIRRASEADGDVSRCVLVVTHDNRIYEFADHLEEMEDGVLKPEPSQEILEHAREEAKARHRHR